MASKSPWNPSEVVLQEVSKNALNDPPLVKKITFNSNDRFQYREHLSVNDIMLNEILSSLSGINQDSLLQASGDDIPRLRTYVSSDRHNQVSAENISGILRIGPNKAKQMLSVTRQRGTRSATLPIGRRYRADRMYDAKRLNGKFSIDTLYENVISLRCNKASQIYSHKCGFKTANHISKVNNEQVGQSLNDFISEYGAPSQLTYDGAAVQVGSNTTFQDAIRKANIQYHVSGPRRPNKNPAEGAIRDINMRWYRIQAKKNVPDRLWNFGISYVCETGNIIPTRELR